MTKKTIWVIDDDEIYQMLIDRLIKKSEIFSSLNIFKNGKEAIDALSSTLDNKEAIPDYILLDINMPIMNGWEFMEELGVIKPTINKLIKVYTVSSSIAIQDKNKSKTYPDILGFLSKPISVDDLLAIASKD